MRKIDKLKSQAREACMNRGHVLPRGWRNLDRKPTKRAHTWCVACGMGVYVDRNPPPNGIDISGAAVACDCTGNFIQIEDRD